MDQYPIRWQIADVESHVLSLAESLALLPVDQRALATADLQRVRAALTGLLSAALAPHELIDSPSLPDAAATSAGDGADQVVWNANRTTSLYAINAALSFALLPAQVAQVVVDQALPAVSADAGIILLAASGATFKAINEANQVANIPIDATLFADPAPFAEATRLLQPIWIESRAELVARYPSWSAPGWNDFAATAAVPLVVQGKVLGVMAFGFVAPRSFTIADRAFMLVLAQQCAAALERVQLYEQVRQAAALQERNRLARDLHDSVSQALYAIVLSVSAGRANLEKDLSRVARALDNIQSLASAAQADLRALLFDLRFDSVAQVGLVNALLERAQFLRLRHGVAIRTVLCDEPDLLPPCKEALYGIAREALHNAAKHARATQLEVILSQAAGLLVLEVTDNGIGFVPGALQPGHYGLQSMRERAAQLGAELSIETALGQGTRVKVIVPTSRTSEGGGPTLGCV